MATAAAASSSPGTSRVGARRAWIRFRAEQRLAFRARCPLRVLHYHGRRRRQAVMVLEGEVPTSRSTSASSRRPSAKASRSCSARRTAACSGSREGLAPLRGAVGVRPCSTTCALAPYKREDDAACLERRAVRDRLAGQRPPSVRQTPGYPSSKTLPRSGYRRCAREILLLAPTDSFVRVCIAAARRSRHPALHLHASSPAGSLLRARSTSRRRRGGALVREHRPAWCSTLVAHTAV